MGVDGGDSRKLNSFTALVNFNESARRRQLRSKARSG
jgi:hypothetical protein